MSIVSVDNIQPIGSGTTVTVNKSVTLESGNTNITGVCTATSFSGSGANLTNLPSQVTINNASGNRVITSDGGTTLNGESGVTYDGTDFTVSSGRVTISDESSGSQFRIGAGNDFQIEHDGSNSYIYNLTNNLLIQNDAAVEITAKSGGTKRFRFDSDGLKFGTDTAAANALDDYEEGDINVTLVGQYGGSISYGYRVGRYIKIGSLVHFTGDVRLSGSWSGNSGNVYIELPFTSYSSGGTVGNGIVAEWNLGNSNWDSLMLQVDNNAANAKITTHSGSNNNTSYLQTGELGNTRYLKFGVTYHTHL